MLYCTILYPAVIQLPPAAVRRSPVLHLPPVVRASVEL